MLRSAINPHTHRALAHVRPALLRVLVCQHGTQGAETTARGFVSESKIAGFTPKTENRAKLRKVFKEYYEANYAHTVPSRFFKEVISAADENKDGVIEFEEMRRLLERIGYGDSVSDDEIKGCLAEFGATDLTIPTEKMLDILLHPEKDPSA